MTIKSDTGNFFEDFVVGDELVHATPRTVTEADAAIYTGLTGSRYALYSADTFAQDIGLEGAPIDPLLAFHIVFGKTVPDISLNAVANLGYADGRFLAPVYPGDTLRAVSEVIGVKENSNGKTGVVYVRTRGYNQQDQEVLSYVRWVMVNKGDVTKPAPVTVAPDLPSAVDPRELPRRGYAMEDYDFTLAGAPFGFEDYEIGEKIDHVDAFTVEEAEHQIATRLYQNTAKVHFNQFAQSQTPRGRRLIYGNAAELIAINAGAHVTPLAAGDTVFAWSEVLDKADLGDGLGALRLRLVATRNLPCTDFPYRDAEGRYLTEVILDFDYWAAIPKRG